jgi:hypothetical protein
MPVKFSSRMPASGSAYETDLMGCAVDMGGFASSPLSAIAVGLETVQVFTVVTLSGRSRSARSRPISEMLSRCAMSAGGVKRGWAHGDPS